LVEFALLLLLLLFSIDEDDTEFVSPAFEAVVVD
jgi:hypothetical protein